MINKKENPLNRIKRLSRQTQALEIKTEADNSANKKQTRTVKVNKKENQYKDSQKSEERSPDNKIKRRKNTVDRNEQKTGTKTPYRRREKKDIQEKNLDKNFDKKIENKPEPLMKTLEEQVISIIKDKETKSKRGRGKAKNNKKVKIIPLGGLEQIGMNITAFEYDDSIFVVDCGLAFPSEDMLGIDLVIPDVTYLKDNFSKLKGFVITHGHEDHIGALPYILKQINIPVYGTKLTLALIEKKLK